jgi:dTDP-glucose 4,6-dehydratase
VGGREDWAVSIEELADIVLKATGASSKLVEYKGEEGFTTRVKAVDFSKSRRDLRHDPKIDVHEGVRRYVAWCREVYKK